MDLDSATLYCKKRQKENGRYERGVYKYTFYLNHITWYNNN
jgi:hypothetical protein